MYNVKKTLVVAVGATLSAVSLWAAADVKIGGMAQVEIAREETKNAAGATTRTETTVEDNTRGRFWITADEDLGGGLKGLAHFEFGVDTTGNCALEGALPTGGCGTTGLFQNVREKWVGLKSNFGTVKLGSNPTPYRTYGGVMWDAFVTTNLEARGNGGMSGGAFGHFNYFDNSLAYESPSWMGLSMKLVYSFDDAATAASTADDGDYSIGVQWTGLDGALQIIAVRNEDKNNSSGAAGDLNIEERNKFGVKYTFLKNYTVLAQFEQIKNDADTTDADVWFLGFQARFGNVLGVVQAGNTDGRIATTTPALAAGTCGTGANVDCDYLAVGALYYFSKTFNLTGGYRKTEVDNGIQDKVWAVGMRKLF
ncbi:MAG: porin [Gammaproteobacteria bacterium]|nr:porin [Gammaproteobacteria bacterium]